MSMKQKKKCLFMILFGLIMTTGFMFSMPKDVNAADNFVKVGAFTLSRDSGEIIEGRDYTYGKGKDYSLVTSLTILTDNITIAMEPGAEPTSDSIYLGVFNNPPYDSFSNVTFANLNVRSNYTAIYSYVDNIHITLVGDNRIVSIKQPDEEYGGHAIFGYGSITIENSPNGYLYASSDGLGWGAVMVSSSYGKQDACFKVGDTMVLKSSVNMYESISNLTDTPKIWMNGHHIATEWGGGYAKTLLISQGKHIHSWKYAAGTGSNSNKITASCSEINDADCNAKNADLSLTLNASDAFNDGTAKAAKIETSADWTQFNVPVPKLVYYLSGTDTKTDSDNSGADMVGGAPKKSGRYRAQVSAGTDAIASIEYKIETVQPVIIEGANKEWVKDSNAVMSFRSDADIDTFLRVEVDGAIVDAKNYTVTQGSTIVTFTADYMGSLATGKHTISIVSSIRGAEKKATAEFSIKDKTIGGNIITGNNNQDADDDDKDSSVINSNINSSINDNNNTQNVSDSANQTSPKTGDEAPIMYLLTLMLLSAAMIMFAKKVQIKL